MNRTAKLVLSFLWLATSLPATPELVGVFITPGAERFALADSDGSQPIRWVRVGQQFEGYTVAEYLSDTETLTLRNDTGTMRLALRKAKIAALAPEADAMLAIAMQAVASNEHWTEPIRYQGPHLFKNNWVVVAHHDVAGGAETRVVVFTALGVMRDYLTQPALSP